MKRLPRALHSPLHRVPVLWSLYRPLLRSTNDYSRLQLPVEHAQALTSYIRLRFKQGRHLRGLDKVRKQLIEAEQVRSPPPLSREPVLLFPTAQTDGGQSRAFSWNSSSANSTRQPNPTCRPTASGSLPPISLLANPSVLFGPRLQSPIERYGNHASRLRSCTRPTSTTRSRASDLNQSKSA